MQNGEEKILRKDDLMNYYNEIKNEIINNEINKKIKDYSKNKSDLESKYKIGKLLSEAGKHYGEGIVKEYSMKLSKELGKTYSYRTLNYMIKFYKFQKMQSLTANLSWGHWIELLSIKDINKVRYYIEQCEKLLLTTRQLREKIKNKEYERLPEDTKLKLINKDNSKTVTDEIKNPIIIRNPSNYEVISEKILKKLILEDIDNFLLELGSGFSYIGNEYKIKIGDNYNYIDILLYSILYNCYVVVELKTTKLKKEHIGQIEVYMNYIDNNLRKINQDKTIGIIVCKKDNKYIIRYSSDKRITSKEYKLIYS